MNQDSRWSKCNPLEDALEQLVKGATQHHLW